MIIEITQDEKDNLHLERTEEGTKKLSEGYMQHIAQYIDGLGEIVDGKLTETQKEMIQKAYDNNELNMLDKIKESVFTKFDDNLIFGQAYDKIPTGNITTDEHDKMVAKVEQKYDTKNDVFKIGTIAPSFIMTEILNAMGEAKQLLKTDNKEK